MPARGVGICSNALMVLRFLASVSAEHALAAEAEDDVLGRHLVAVVEFDALAKLQLDDLVVDATPFGGKARRHAQVAAPVLADQTLPTSEEKNTRSPTFDCSRSTSSVLELVTF